MPVAPALPCPTPGCARLQPCPAHSRESRVQRGNVDVRKWYRIARWRHPAWGRRAQTLARDPLCVVCLPLGRIEPSTDVDHVIPHNGDADLFWDPQNLQGLCHSCHSVKTQGEQ